MIKTRPYITVLFLALWFASVHHCVLEFLISDSSNPLANAADSPSKDCKSHDTKDSSSHEEGKPCNPVGVKLTEQSSLDLKIAFVNLDLFLNHLTLQNIPYLGFSRSKELESFIPLRTKESLTSLTLASNAPPFLA